ncbi:MAG: nitrous oxide reductase accessory protein NosL [Haloquadratum sp.]
MCETYPPGRGDDRTAGDGVRRRRLLLATGGALSASLAGCLGGGGDGADAPDAVTVPEGATCDVCGMVIRQHPGPTTEIFYADHEPSGHDNPARFDSTWEAYQYEFEREGRGWTDTAFYVTDYSSVDYRITTDGGDKLISRHYRASAFAPASAVTYVVNSEVKGTMGRDLLGFTDRDDAESFKAEHGGSLTTHEGVTPEVIAGLG